MFKKNLFQIYKFENYCLSYECHENVSEDYSDPDGEDYSDSSEWVIKLKACLCLDETIGTKFITDAMDRVEDSIRCCGTQPIKDSNCTTDEINVIDKNLVANNGRITGYMVRSDGGNTSFLTSNAQIHRNKITETVNIIKSNMKPNKTLSDVFHETNLCLGPAWITSREAEDVKDEPLQLKLFEYKPPCNGSKPCMR